MTSDERRPREFKVREFHWNDGDITYDIVKDSYKGNEKAPSFLVREVMPDDSYKVIKATIEDDEGNKIYSEVLKRIQKIKKGDGE